MDMNIASSIEAEIGTEPVKPILLTPARYKELLSTLESLQRENEALKAALLQIAEDAESPRIFYDRNGPQWRTPSGAEYENTSDFLAKCNELASTARAALSSTGDTHGN